MSPHELLILPRATWICVITISYSTADGSCPILHLDIQMYNKFPTWQQIVPNSILFICVRSLPVFSFKLSYSLPDVKHQQAEALNQACPSWEALKHCRSVLSLLQSSALCFLHRFLRHMLKFCLSTSLSAPEYSTGNILENDVVEVLVFSSPSNSRTSLTPFLFSVPTWTIFYQHFPESRFTNLPRVERTNTT